MLQSQQEIIEFIEQTEEVIAPQLKKVDRLIDQNQWKVIRAFQNNQVSDFHFSPSTGYGYNDRGREVLDQVYADVFGAEAAIVRPHFVSGTHVLNVALFGLLRPGDELLYITGKPYDTLHKVIGQSGDGKGSLRDFGITYNEVDLLANGEVDWEHVSQKINAKTKVVGIQRSRGYSWRSSFTIEQISEMVRKIKSIDERIIIFIDNCYGEFTELLEPTQVGADLIAGSLIKNPGGGLALSGGYIAGKAEYVEAASFRLTAPGLGGEVGAMMGALRSFYQGLYIAPHAVGQALKGSVLTAAAFDRLGFATQPAWNGDRSDIIQAILFEKEQQLIDFVQGIQQAAAVDSHVTPVPSPMPGYEHSVIMAAGTFVQGGSLELSADAPIREPYIAYMQGGLTYSHVKLALLTSISKVLKI